MSGVVSDVGTRLVVTMVVGSKELVRVLEVED